MYLFSFKAGFKAAQGSVKFSFFVVKKGLVFVVKKAYVMKGITKHFLR